MIASRLTTDLHIDAPAVVEGNTFSVIGLAPGHYTVDARSGAETDGVAVAVRSGETAHVTLKSRGTARIDGKIAELGTGKALPGAHCQANLSMGGQMGAPSDDPNAGTDLDVAPNASPTADVCSVKNTFGTARSDPGFTITPLVPPLTVQQVTPAAAGLAPGDHLVAAARRERSACGSARRTPDTLRACKTCKDAWRGSPVRRAGSGSRSRSGCPPRR